MQRGRFGGDGLGRKVSKRTDTEEGRTQKEKDEHKRRANTRFPLRKKPTMNPIPESVRKELAALAEMSDEDIDYSDIPATKDEDWVNAVRGKFYRPDTHFKHKQD